MLRRLIFSFWPNTISNGELYGNTKSEPWNIKIKRRRITLFGQVVRMNLDTPAWKAFTEALADHEIVGRPPLSWLKKSETLKPVTNVKLETEKAIRELEKVVVDSNS